MNNMDNALYVTDEDSPWGPGRPVCTQSMMKTFLQCPREAYYKYRLRLQPKQVSVPLTRGKWIHALLETYYGQLLEGSSKKKAEKAMWHEHAKWCGRFDKLFDEEKDRIGDLPREIQQVLKGYFWHYGDPLFKDHTDWEVLAIEQTLEAEMPNGHIFRGRFDMMVQNEFGVWLVDHKTHKTLPDWSHRMMDVQAPLYTWAARQNDIPVQGFIWNYLGMGRRTVPVVLKNGVQFSTRGWDSTDYPTALKAVKDAGWIQDVDGHSRVVAPSEEETERVRGRLRALREQRWAPGKVDTSPFFRRDEITHDDDMVERVLTSACHTSERMHSYDWSNPDAVERNISECKSGWRCSYSTLAMADLVTGDSSRIQRQDYIEGDALAYYQGSDAEQTL